MKKKICLLILFYLLFFLNLFSQSGIYKFVYENTAYKAFKIKIDSNHLEKLQIYENEEKLTFSELLNDINIKDSLLFITNCCIQDINFKPVGLLLKDYKTIHDVNLESGNGNFYLKPNGIFYSNGKSANIIRSEDFKMDSTIKFGFQSGPLLVENGNINNNFNKTSKNKFIRLGVGIMDNLGIQYLLFIKSDIPVNFYDFAKVFYYQFGIKYALCIESSGCVFYDSKYKIDSNSLSYVIGNYLIFSDSNKGINKKEYSIAIKFEKSGIYSIPVLLNDVLKINMVFDSGAADLTITPDIALTLIKTGTIDDSDYIGTQKYMFANGQTANSSIFNLKEVKIGDKRIFNVRASISNNINSPLLFGQSALKKLGTYIVDNKNNKLIFH